MPGVTQRDAYESTQTPETRIEQHGKKEKMTREGVAQKASEVIGPQLSKETRNFLDRDNKKGWRDFVSFCVFADRIGYI